MAPQATITSFLGDVSDCDDLATRNTSTPKHRLLRLLEEPPQPSHRAAALQLRLQERHEGRTLRPAQEGEPGAEEDEPAAEARARPGQGEEPLHEQQRQVRESASPHQRATRCF